ncbi:aminotransferase class I/II-fold pyridoxal phosphate-dependent enzyme [Undibacterium sp. Ji22W]|uniref:aminotransferase class I/II-fold pyridoxal phosphate-dependent enzyme n=1 Tax=Undibacterium sp. Ji22W TaxID=3413038 RepID=UPI003BF188C8
MFDSASTMNAHPAKVRRIHGGTDTHGKPLFDFSTNSNALGPCPPAMRMIRNADCSGYPDPEYQALRESLGRWHGVAPQRILIAASASEFIYRMSIAFAMRTTQNRKQVDQQDHSKTVWIPPHSYGDYALAARAAGLGFSDEFSAAGLIWTCEPGSPLGQNQAGLTQMLNALPATSQLVLDCAYQPLRLSSQASVSAEHLARCWQMFTPNKALGLTGIRGAYVVAPLDADEWQQTLEQLAPSWVLGVHAVAMLSSWSSAPVQEWLSNSLSSLRDWKRRQIAICQDLGWQVIPSHANFFCAMPTELLQENRRDFLHDLRNRGIKLRHAESFGLPACFRLGVLNPQAQDALQRAVQEFSPRFF